MLHQQNLHRVGCFGLVWLSRADIPWVAIRHALSFEYRNLVERISRTAKLRTGFLIIIVVAVSALSVAVTWPFLKPLLLAALFAALAHPLYKWMARLLGQRRSLASLVTLLVLFVLIIGPLSAFVGLVIRQAVSMINF